MPALGKVKKQAKAMVCATRVRQLTLGLNTFAFDHDNKTFPVGAKEEYWLYKIAPYLGDDHFLETGASDGGGMEVIRCPSTKARKIPPAAETFSWGDAKNTWVAFDTEGSIGINMWLTPEGEWSNPPNFPEEHLNRFFSNLAQVSGRTPTFADSVWTGSYPFPFESTDISVPIVGGTNDRYDGVGKNFSHTPENFMKRFCLDRHDMAINVAFVDGSTEKIPLKELWTLRWSKKFAPQQVDLPQRER